MIFKEKIKDKTGQKAWFFLEIMFQNWTVWNVWNIFKSIVNALNTNISANAVHCIAIYRLAINTCMNNCFIYKDWIGWEGLEGERGMY